MTANHTIAICSQKTKVLPLCGSMLCWGPCSDNSSVLFAENRHSGGFPKTCSGVCQFSENKWFYEGTRDSSFKENNKIVFPKQGKKNGFETIL